MITEAKNYLCYTIGGGINLGAFLLEKTMTAEDVRIWVTFAIGTTIGILTIVKIIYDLVVKINNRKK